MYLIDVTVEASPSNNTWFRKACEATLKPGMTSKVSKKKMYQAEHSPIRTQMFFISLKRIPTFVANHFVRHKIGVEHFVESNRTDRGGSNEVNRMTPVNMCMCANAQALINMGRKRLCRQASSETRQVMEAIREEVRKVDPDLASFMVPECVYRGGCKELKKCST